MEQIDTTQAGWLRPHWIKALRSGEYTQATGWYNGRNDKEFCAIGLSYAVKKKLGIDSSDGAIFMLGLSTKPVIDDNDTGRLTFAMIADKYEHAPVVNPFDASL